MSQQLVSRFWQAALAHQAAGDLLAAERDCREAVSRAPDCAELWHLLGQCMLEQGRAREAIAPLSKVVEMSPQFASYYVTLGRAARDADRLDVAVACFRQAAALDGSLPEAWQRLGEALQSQRDLAAATVAYQQTLQLAPQDFVTHNLLGNVYQELSRFNDAAACFARAIELQPNDVEAYLNSGSVFAQQQRWSESEDAYQRAVLLAPDFSAAHYNLGCVLAKQQRWADAIVAYRRALQTEPNSPNVWNNLGLALDATGASDEAEAAFRVAIQGNPNYAEAFANLGSCLTKRERFDEAIAAHQTGLAIAAAHGATDALVAEMQLGLGTALLRAGRYEESLQCHTAAAKLCPATPLTHFNLGFLHARLNQLDAAIAGYRRAVELDPRDASSRQWIGTLQLLQGDFENGWAGYEHRWQTREFHGQVFADAPRWQGEPLSGRTIVVHSEQGFGDTLQFVRYAALLKERGARVIFECQPALAPLLASCPPIDQLVSRGQRLPPADFQIPLLSVPHVVETRGDNMPACVPYLFADRKLVDVWGRRLKAWSGLRVGINWQGNPKYATDRERSIPLAAFEPLATVAGVTFFSLQKGFGREQLAAVSSRWPVVDWADELDTTTGAFMDTAALMTGLDLVITSDTAVPHLAGALGVPTWVALPAAPDWRWFLNRDDSPWYPTMRLFRQASRGDWSDVFTKIRDALNKHTARIPAAKETGATPKKTDRPH